MAYPECVVDDKAIEVPRRYSSMVFSSTPDLEIKSASNTGLKCKLTCNENLLDLNQWLFLCYD